ncbi:MAG: hypothetical protein IPH12_11935 [Saprospirales bacterium]|nr:hypothetical protein [Saprospirales bacterium]
MKQDSSVPILSVSALLWDGSRQLSGILELWETLVFFRLDDFKNSHLQLSIPLTELDFVEEYMVFDLAKNGLRIQSKDGRFDLFVLEEGQRFKKAVLAQMRRF